MSDIRILIADDHRLFREGVRHICEMFEGYTVVGEAEDGREAVELTKKLAPDIVLMDINMPILDGVQATSLITEKLPSVRVVILTMYRQDQHIFNAIKAGARGYLLKDIGGQELIDALKAVSCGEAIMTPEIAGKLLDEFRRVSRETEKTGYGERLTPAEMEVLCLVAQGQDNRVIARQLDISQRTVAHRLSEIFDKLHVNNRTQAALVALRKGWASLHPDE
jgi:DNA-binding NarL/FixJ family response regulator